VRLLLDTHALLWAVGSPTELPPRVRALLEDGSTQACVSAASMWEISIKTALGKLALDLGALLAEMRTLEFAELRIGFEHTRRAGTLPPIHRDPFDRMLVAQALEEGLTIVTRDPAIGRYAAPTLWE
jgi:PIN domain nuclease of toxin-antitoxin system